MKRGFTLIEIVIAVGVFAFIISSGSGLFVYSLRAQRRSIAYQQLLDQTSYLTEYMSRAIRMAKKDMSGVCTGTAKLNYAFSGQCLSFKNYKDQCQQFCLDGSRIKDQNGNFLTSPDLSVSSFLVSLAGQTQNDNLQPKVSITLDIQGRDNSTVKIQTAISQRSLDVKK